LGFQKFYAGLNPHISWRDEVVQGWIIGARAAGMGEKTIAYYVMSPEGEEHIGMDESQNPYRY
jgi:hypothetical protein